jgi:hypothetical protein
MEIKGELLFLPGQLLLHWVEKGVHHYKLVSSNSIKAAFSHESIDSGWLSDGIVRWGIGKSGNWVVTFVPPGRHTLFFEQDDAGTPRRPDAERNVSQAPCLGQKSQGSESPTESPDSLVSIQLGSQSPSESSPCRPFSASPRLFSEDSDSLSIPLPGLVFLGYGFQYYIFCIAESSFNPEAEVFTAPLPNVYPDGRICFGSTVPPACTPEEIDTAWKMFITSNFNSHLGSGKSKAYPNDIKTKLSQIATSQLKHYPIKDLNPYRSSVKQVIEPIIYPRYNW